MNNNKGNKLSAIVMLGGVALSIIVMFLGARTEIQPLALVGVGLFFVTVAAGIFVGNGGKAGRSSRESRSVARKYEPLLLDERTKQHPEVQRLLQYTSVQKVFFDPSYFKTSEAQNDPNVRELLAVFDDILSGGAVYGAIGEANMNTNMGTGTDLLSRNEIMRREKAKNRPRKIMGMIFSLVGILLFLLPFGVTMIPLLTNSALSIKPGTVETFFSAAPIGMIFLVIGRVIIGRITKK